jgi:hypothetical protein
MWDSLEPPCRLELEIRCGVLEFVPFELGDWGLFGVFFEADRSISLKYLLSLDRPLTVLLWTWFEVSSWLAAIVFDKVLAVMNYQGSEWMSQW